MAITKILARKGRLDVGIRYVLNGDKTQEQILTAHHGCDPGRELQQMMETKAQYSKEGGVQYYHMIQSFRPGEVSPELALEIARTLVEEHLPGYQAVIGVHVDKAHIHAHILFNSVNAETGEKYHSSPQSYYRQIRAISDRLCREHGLSVILEGQGAGAVSYAEWLRQTRGQPTFRTMLEADLRDAIQDANDLGHFFLLMEHKGWEIRHGSRLGFRLRGQERFLVPGRKDPRYTEEGIRSAIQGELSAIDQGLRPAVIPRPAYHPFRPHPKYRGFLALYTALADVEALAVTRRLYEDGISGMEEQFGRYLDAVARLEGYPREPLLREKAEVYQQLAEVNRQIRQERQKLALCREIQKEVPKIAKTIQPTMEPEKEVNRDECRRR